MGVGSRICATPDTARGSSMEQEAWQGGHNAATETGKHSFLKMVKSIIFKGGKKKVSNMLSQNSWSEEILCSKDFQKKKYSSCKWGEGIIQGETKQKTRTFS